MSIAIIVTDRDCASLMASISRYLPDVHIQLWPDLVDIKSISFAVLWKHPEGILTAMPGLKAVCSLGAGVDFIESDKNLPKNLPILRVVTLSLKQQMAQYVLAYLLSDYRLADDYIRQQKKQKWSVKPLPAESTIVALLGLGPIAEYLAHLLLKLGFQVKAFNCSSRHQLVPTYQGKGGLETVLSDCHYVINLLPLNADTQDILNKNNFALCQNKPLLINVGRGGHLIENDLIEALDDEILSGAVLDVFLNEPLSPDHQFWQHPKIVVTPHMAAISDIEETAQCIAQYYSQYVLNA